MLGSAESHQHTAPLPASVPICTLTRGDGTVPCLPPASPSNSSRQQHEPSPQPRAALSSAGYGDAVASQDRCHRLSGEPLGAGVLQLPKKQPNGPKWLPRSSPTSRPGLAAASLSFQPFSEVRA